MYVGQNPVFGIWFIGKYGGAAGWVIGYVSNLAEGQLTNGLAKGKQDTFCPSSTKVWKEYFNSQWTYSTKGNVKCSSGDKILLIKAWTDFK